MLAVRVNGVETTVRSLATVREGALQAASMRVLIGTDVAYAYGIVYGVRRSGRLARRAGGTFSAPRALQAIAPLVGPALLRAIPQGTRAVRAALLGLGYRLQARWQATEAVKTGNLRRSVHTVEANR